MKDKKRNAYLNTLNVKLTFGISPFTLQTAGFNMGSTTASQSISHIINMSPVLKSQLQHENNFAMVHSGLSFETLFSLFHQITGSMVTM